jgi:hypothetical protein
LQLHSATFSSLALHRLSTHYMIFFSQSRQCVPILKKELNDRPPTGGAHNYT